MGDPWPTHVTTHKEPIDKIDKIDKIERIEKMEKILIARSRRNRHPSLRRSGFWFLNAEEES